MPSIFSDFAIVRIKQVILVTLGFVAKKATHLGKAPTMQASSAFPAPLFGSSSNLAQILNHNRCTRGATLHNPFRENMVAIPPKPLQSVIQLPKMLFSRFCAFGLQGSVEPKGSCGNFFPVATTQKLPFRSHGWSGNTQVNPDNFPAICYLGSGRFTTTCSQN